MYRLIYKSRATSPISWGTVDSIMLKSMQSNMKSSLGGILLCTNSHFFQILEGDQDKVNETFMKIAKDPRHDQIELVAFREIDKHLFHQWKMRVISIADMHDPVQAGLMEKYGSEEDGVQFPVEEWLAMSLLHDIRHIQNPPEWKEKESADE